ncbi:DNA replication factor Cdt1 [Cimex lectularius]|uniref:CDT1 Geminin-binding domain-containing protein n=1 Tax=Cimex lectularius TaxID=79782 RepID=A0A8I6RD69_CIMLE|nr:DNA replication factor Cdt1 [Cimex lectularius]
MALQTSIAEYFNSKKRPAADEIVRSPKVVVLEGVPQETGDFAECCASPKSDALSAYQDSPAAEKLVVYRESPKSAGPKSVQAPKLQRKTPRTAKRIARKDSSETTNGDIRRSLLPSFQNADNEVEPEKDVIVPFQVRGLPSPKKKTKAASIFAKEENDVKKSELVKNGKTQELRLSEVKDKLLKSSRLEKLKQALKKVNESQGQLREVEAKKEALQNSPTFKKFTKIEIEVPTSAGKNFMDETRVASSPSTLRAAVFKSPSKYPPGKMPYISPRKLFDSPQKSPLTSPTKSPAFQTYYNLACAGKPTLVLPYKYKFLAEIFRSVDTVVSIMFNRKETIFFEKLKASVQQMSKKNLTENILGQIKSVLPNSYTFRREKRHTFSNQGEKYELVISPILDGKDHLGPSLLLERQREFFKSLLELVKDHHEVYLQSLIPPLTVPKDKLTRWHPEFNIDNCPDVPSATMPQCLDNEKISSAKEVLTRARDLIGINTRMDKALERLCEKKDKENGITPASQALPGLANALKGIPKSLLEKVRARQAAKAAEFLTRSPEETKRRLEFTRLPEMARIIRNMFVLERKNILSKYTVLEKMQNSYREHLTNKELERHLDLLKESVPGWVIVYDVDGESYVKLAKDADMSRVMTRLEELISENRLNF